MFAARLWYLGYIILYIGAIIVANVLFFTIVLPYLVSIVLYLLFGGLGGIL